MYTHDSREVQTLELQAATPPQLPDPDVVLVEGADDEDVELDGDVVVVDPEPPPILLLTLSHLLLG